MEFSKCHISKMYKYSTYNHPHLRWRRQGLGPPFFHFHKVGRALSPRFRGSCVTQDIKKWKLQNPAFHGDIQTYKYYIHIFCLMVALLLYNFNLVIFTDAIFNFILVQSLILINSLIYLHSFDRQKMVCLTEIDT